MDVRGGLNNEGGAAGFPGRAAAESENKGRACWGGNENMEKEKVRTGAECRAAAIQ